jgi:hypothetical protein
MDRIHVEIAKKRRRKAMTTTPTTVLIATMMTSDPTVLQITMNTMSEIMRAVVFAFVVDAPMILQIVTTVDAHVQSLVWKDGVKNVRKRIAKLII